MEANRVQRSAPLRSLTTAEVLHEQVKGALLVDTRPAERFASLHLQGAIQLGLQGPFASWAAILIRPTQALVVLASDSIDAQEARVRLARVGLDDVIGYAVTEERRWRDDGIGVASIAVHRCRSLQKILENDPSVQIVDVRSRSEWLKGHLPGAISMPLLDVDSSGQCIDRSRSSLAYCQEGYRATTAASILLRHGAREIGILIDGIEGWLAAGLPLETPDSR
jgi:rhodanese-related sulfurtransferase